MVDPKILHDKDFLGTLLVAVPLTLEQDWLGSYPTLSTLAAVSSKIYPRCYTT
jgi:hypothetical protein